MGNFEFETAECWFMDASEWGLNTEEQQILAEWKEQNPNFTENAPERELENYKGLILEESADMCDVDGKQLLFLAEEAARKCCQREPLVASGLRKIQHAIYFEVHCLGDEETDFLDRWWPDLFDSFSHDVFLSSHYGDRRTILRYCDDAKEDIKEIEYEIRNMFINHRKSQAQNG